MKKVIITKKNIGETPLESLERVRKSENTSQETPMTYAGRLDPMAEGVLIILVGDECKNKENYLGLDKEYEIDVLFGIKTDTQDVLGLISGIDLDKPKEIDLSDYEGRFNQTYPRYSSKVIAMANTGKELPEEMPTKDVEIYSIEKINEGELSGLSIAENIIDRIMKVKGDFRQQEIIEEWKSFAEEFQQIDFKIISLRVRCSSGTYMRSLAERIGEDAGVGAIAYSINRTKVEME